MYRRVPTRKVLLTALLVALVCSAVVTVSTVMLRPVQEQNRQAYMKKNILKVAGLWQRGQRLETQLQQLETRLVELASGRFVEAEDAAAYDHVAAARDPARSIALSPQQDIAGIRRRAHHAAVYLTRDEQGAIQSLVLPVYGYGLWSTLYGFIALEADTRTVIGLRFYEHGETPGLGGEVDNRRWLAKWQGKQVFDANWRPTIKLVKGGIDRGSADAKHQVDAISGASLTNRGIENLIRFWLGDDGFGPFLMLVRETGGRYD